MRSLFIIFILLIFAACTNTPTDNSTQNDFHIHADFKVYLNGIPYNFSKAKYMSTDTAKLDESIHLHDLDGEVIHMHNIKTTLGEFFSSLGMQFTKDCFILDNGKKYCNNQENTLKMYVNGVENKDYNNYVFKDLDRILITYGNGSDLQNQLNSVTDKACIESGKCPERGTSTEDSCSTSDVCAIQI